MMAVPPRLVLFTRYPTAGLAKTRLIPALGADGAAALHRRLTERALGTLRASGLPMEIRTTGGTAAMFEAWLGAEVALVDQGDGDLGARMARAAAHLPVVLLGADVPDLSLRQVAAAAAALAEGAAVVIGPAEDGGYYLLGLGAALPWLFEDMPWGTGAVLALTVQRLAQRGIVPVLLDTLADLDRPEDLRRWPELQG